MMRLFRFDVSVYAALMLFGLQLGHQISWPWYWIVAPIWLPFAFWIVVIILFLFVLLLYFICDSAVELLCKLCKN